MPLRSRTLRPSCMPSPHLERRRPHALPASSVFARRRASAARRPFAFAAETTILMRRAARSPSSHPPSTERQTFGQRAPHPNAPSMFPTAADCTDELAGHTIISAKSTDARRGAIMAISIPSDISTVGRNPRTPIELSLIPRRFCRRLRRREIRGLVYLIDASARLRISRVQGSIPLKPMTIATGRSTDSPLMPATRMRPRKLWLRPPTPRLFKHTVDEPAPSELEIAAVAVRPAPPAPLTWQNTVVTHPFFTTINPGTHPNFETPTLMNRVPSCVRDSGCARRAARPGHATPMNAPLCALFPMRHVRSRCPTPES